MNTQIAGSNLPPADALHSATHGAAHSATATAATATTATTAGPVQRGRALGTLLIVDALLSFAPLAIMVPAIGWPASLGNPAAQQPSS